MRRQLVSGLAVAALFTATVVAGDALKSGPQVGEQVPGPFHPLNCNGQAAGKKNCLYCQNGDKAVAMVFARKISDPLTKLIKKIDAANGKRDKDMGSFVVFCSDEEGLADQLTKLAKDQGLKNTVLAIDEPAGPEKYNIAKEADVTVVLYKEHKVKANHAFKKGNLDEKAIEKVVDEISKVLN
jgi:hypothetical protein